MGCLELFSVIPLRCNILDYYAVPGHLNRTWADVVVVISLLSRPPHGGPAECPTPSLLTLLSSIRGVGGLNTFSRESSTLLRVVDCRLPTIAITFAKQSAHGILVPQVATAGGPTEMTAAGCGGQPQAETAASRDGPRLPLRRQRAAIAQTTEIRPTVADVDGSRQRRRPPGVAWRSTPPPSLALRPSLRRPPCRGQIEDRSAAASSAQSAAVHAGAWRRAAPSVQAALDRMCGPPGRSARAPALPTGQGGPCRRGSRPRSP